MIWWELTGRTIFSKGTTPGESSGMKVDEDHGPWIWHDRIGGEWWMTKKKGCVALLRLFLVSLEAGCYSWRNVAAFPEWIWVDSALRLAPRRISELAPRLSLFWNGVSKDYLLWCILGRHWSGAGWKNDVKQKQLIGKSGRSGIIIL